SWEDKEGNKKFATEIVGDNLIMLDKRNEGGQPMQGFDNIENLGPSDADIPPPSNDAGDERLPF
ncbi:MAG TPA: hypothetical protein VLR49_05430, partial [Ferruginibacter sp.]|nr:hypothetical protein [Ferruginibacter sp.]